MRKENLIVMALVAICVLAAPLSLGQGGNPPASTKGKVGGNAEQQIKALHKEGRQATLKGDTSFLEKYLADDYIGVGGDGRMFTKDQTIQRRKSGAVKVESIEELAVKIRVYGDTAIVNSLALRKSDDRWETDQWRQPCDVLVWVKQKGSWKPRFRSPRLHQRTSEGFH